MSIIMLALKSIWNRRITAILTIVTIAFSVTLLLGVEKIRKGARASFANTISGTDLIVGARSGPIQLLLYSVFRIGNATNNISWESYQDFAKRSRVKWTIPISLGDSHRGFRVMGTTPNYFEHYKYGRSRPLEFIEGKQFNGLYDTVLGADVAKELKYQLGKKIVLSHGVSDVSFMNHEDKPFRVVGILKKTGTPVDRTVHIGLEGIEAIHLGWERGAPPMPGQETAAAEAEKMKLQPKAITAFFVGLKSRISTFRLQREINDYKEEPLLAVLPGVALQQLWGLIGMAEAALIVISIFVVLTGLMGMLTAILTSLNERRREMAILRSVGARPYHVFSLMVSEAGILSFIGSLAGVLLLYFLLIVAQPIVETKFGFFIEIEMLSLYDFSILGAIVLMGFFMGCAPAWRAYRNSLADGMTIRV